MLTIHKKVDAEIGCVLNLVLFLSNGVFNIPSTPQKIFASSVLTTTNSSKLLKEVITYLARKYIENHNTKLFANENGIDLCMSFLMVNGPHGTIDR